MNQRKTPSGNQIKRERRKIPLVIKSTKQQEEKEASRLNGKALKTVMKLIEACDNIMQAIKYKAYIILTSFIILPTFQLLFPCCFW